MGSNRAAWLFAAGLAWLVLRGILAPTFPLMDIQSAVERGGIVMLFPVLSLVACASVPLFFFSFLTGHRFDGQAMLRWATVLALVASLVSCGLVVAAFVRALGAGGEAVVVQWGIPPALVTWVSLLFVVSMLLYLTVFSLQETGDRQLVLAARTAAAGSLVPMLMMIGWIVYMTTPGVLPWLPEFTTGLPAKALGIGAAGTLLWFLESFATRYGE